ncbi:MAG: acetylornithine/succinylornithine family transaminase [Myxococcales bacterium]|nr:acetylornithine/succinylornithine family transaminase [Polyangiaceae bacterium]MDW8251299.1 acetylornithine/succinylornithine family transaminase [Myxococcales bacterium]
MTRSLLELAQAHLYGNYRPAPFVLSHGRGCELFDTEGRRYLDMAAGVAVCTLGHGHPRYVAALCEQVARLGHVSNYFYNEPNVRLAVELCRRTGFDRAFFCNSGAEANEALLKLARRHFHAQGQAERHKILAFDNSFHGRTMGALAMTGQAKYQQGFGPGVGGVVHLPFGDLPAVEATIDETFAAIIVEPVQGEGGVIPAAPVFLQGLRRLCDERGVLLLIDEIQTGVGRTGTFLAHEQAGIKADAISLAKGLGGGFPIGVMLCRERLAGALPPGTHGSTFGGNPLASAAALAVLDVLDAEDLTGGARRKGEYLSARLRRAVEEHPDVFEGERGLGLMRGLVMRPGVDGRAALARVRERGVLLTVAGERTLRFTPPLVVTEAQLDEAIDGVIAALCGA